MFIAINLKTICNCNVELERLTYDVGASIDRIYAYVSFKLHLIPMIIHCSSGEKKDKTCRSTRMSSMKKGRGGTENNQFRKVRGQNEEWHH